MRMLPEGSRESIYTQTVHLRRLKPQSLEDEPNTEEYDSWEGTTKAIKKELEKRVGEIKSEFNNKIGDINGKMEAYVKKEMEDVKKELKAEMSTVNANVAKI